jgi:hypothetical protein
LIKTTEANDAVWDENAIKLRHDHLAEEAYRKIWKL